LKVAADCGITTAEGDDARSPPEPTRGLSSHQEANFEVGRRGWGWATMNFDETPFPETW
jgi:hypothetical protein